MRNLFPYIAKTPPELLNVEQPTGGDRGDQELRKAANASLVVAANRGSEVVSGSIETGSVGEGRTP
jgi:hypothetical protein